MGMVGQSRLYLVSTSIKLLFRNDLYPPIVFLRTLHILVLTLCLLVFPFSSLAVSLPSFILRSPPHSNFDCLTGSEPYHQGPRDHHHRQPGPSSL